MRTICNVTFTEKNIVNTLQNKMDLRKMKKKNPFSMNLFFKLLTTFYMLTGKCCNCSLTTVKCKVKQSGKEVGLRYLSKSTHHILQQVFLCSPQSHSTQHPQKSWSDRCCRTSSPTPLCDSPPVLEVSGSRPGFWSGISRSPYQRAAQSCSDLPQGRGREQGDSLSNSKRNL